MICKTCGTEIADKAIVCYRCGAATAEPRRHPPAAPAGWPRGVGFAAVAVTTVVVSRAIRRRFRR